MGRRKQANPQRRVVVDSENHPVEIEAVRTVEAPASAELAGSQNQQAMPYAPSLAAERTADAVAATAEAVATVTEGATAETPVAEAAPVATPTVTATAEATAEATTAEADRSAEGPVGQTERAEQTETAGPTGSASAVAPTAEPTLLQKVYNWLMT